MSRILRGRALAIAAVFACGVAVGVLGTRAAGAEPRREPSAPTPVQLLRTDLQGFPGDEVVITTTEWAPGQRLPLHVHPGGHEFAYVLEGAITYEVAGQGTTTVNAGELHHVLPDVAHFGRNDGASRARTLVFRVKPRSQPITLAVSATP